MIKKKSEIQVSFIGKPQWEAGWPFLEFLYSINRPSGLLSLILTGKKIYKIKNKKFIHFFLCIINLQRLI